ncbi:vWA domain-containing protein [Nannocystis pusilla]|uniref:vWA domain-containing protein n=1 Tax=Nannocystis pusilla TaxID=889268 RepID=UPI003B8083E5
MVAALSGCGGVGGTPGTDTDTGSTTGIPGITSVTTTETGGPTTTRTTTDGAIKFDLPVGPGSETDSDGSDTSVCADADVTFEPQIPTVLLLIDQSGSMTTQFGDTDRWEAVYNALLDPDDGLVPQLEGQVRFGMALYTSFEGNQGGRECPVITETPPALDNYQAIAATWDASQPEDETPTGESIAAVTPTLVMDPSEGTKIIVLATDGEPDTCAEPNPQNGQDESVEAAAAAFGQGVRTYVISVGNEVSDQHLQDVANAGAGVGNGDPDAPFYKADDAQALADAFADIVDGVRDCKLTLDGTVSEGGEDQCTVYVNGEAIPFGDDNGWQLNNPGEVELVGDACDAIQNGEVQVSIKCACGVVVPPG